MRARYINEASSDILKPIDSKQVEEIFRSRFNMSWKKYMSYIDTLKKNGVRVIKDWDSVTKGAVVKQYSVMSNNWQCATTATRKDAEAIVQSMIQHTYSDSTYRIETDTMNTYLTPADVRSLARKMSAKIRYYGMPYGERTNLRDKYDNSDYSNWSSNNQDLYSEYYKKRLEQRSKVDENMGILKPKSDSEIEKEWKSSIPYKEYKSTLEKLKGTGIHVYGSGVGFSDEALFKVAGFDVIRNNHVLFTVLRKEDAEEVVDTIKKYEYRGNSVYRISDTDVLLYYNEALHYLKKFTK